MKGAIQGHVQSLHNVGYLYYEGGGGIEKDVKKAAEWFRKAADLDFSLSQRLLGIILLSGEGGAPQNATEGLKFLKRAAKTDVMAQLELSNIFKEGRYGIPINEKLGQRYLKKYEDKMAFYEQYRRK